MSTNIVLRISSVSSVDGRCFCSLFRLSSGSWCRCRCHRRRRDCSFRRFRFAFASAALARLSAVGRFEDEDVTGCRFDDLTERDELERTFAGSVRRRAEDEGFNLLKQQRSF